MNLKDKSNLLLIILPILFIGFHYIVYVKHFQSPFLSPAAEPLNIEKIVLIKTIYPNYFNPFQKFEYHYAEKGRNETVVIEQGSMFETNMNVIYGDYLKYYNPSVDGMFSKGFAVDDYPNGLFFLAQYSIIIAFVFLAIKKILQFKKANWHSA